MKIQLEFIIILTLVLVAIVFSVYFITKKDTAVVSGLFRWQLMPLHSIPLPIVEEETAGERASRPALPSSANLMTGTIHGMDASKYILDQGIWGSCTAFAMKYAYFIYFTRSTFVDISPAYIYYKSRQIGGYGRQDTGSTNIATVRAVQSAGVVPEASYPYWGMNIFGIPPSGLIGSRSGTFQSIPFSRSTDTTLLRIQTALQTSPVIVGILVFSSALTTQVMTTGTIPYPSSKDIRNGAVGGHAICITGYDNTTQNFLFHNSWGSYVGNAGHFTIPYNYLTAVGSSSPKFAFDMWSLPL